MRLTKKGFRGWLESKAPGAGVGNPHSCGRCPLCQFVQESGIGPRPDFDFDHWMPDVRLDVVRRVPGWATKFQIAACTAARTRITARKALEILGGC